MAKMYVSVLVKYPLILMTLAFSRRIFEKYSYHIS
jgi:hypothetical protein